MPSHNNAGGKKKPIFAERFKTSLCKNFVEHGECQYGSRCMFAHGEHELRTKQQNVDDGLLRESRIHARRRAAASNSANDDDGLPVPTAGAIVDTAAAIPDATATTAGSAANTDATNATNAPAAQLHLSSPTESPDVASAEIRSASSADDSGCCDLAAAVLRSVPAAAKASPRFRRDPYSASRPVLVLARSTSGSDTQRDGLSATPPSVHNGAPALGTTALLPLDDAASRSSLGWATRSFEGAGWVSAGGSSTAVVHNPYAAVPRSSATTRRL